MTDAENIWFILSCICFGAGYFSSLPVKKGFSDAGVGTMTQAGSFWYVLQNIGFGYGYFKKIPVAKALTAVTAFPKS